MRGLPPRERETQDLIDRFRAKRARRRHLRWVMTVIVALVIIGAVLAAVALAAGSGNGDNTVAVSSSTSSTATAAGGVTSSTGVTTTAGVTTTTGADGTTSTSGPTALSSTTSTSRVGTTSTSRTTTTVEPTTTTVRSTTTTAAKTTATSLSAAASTKVVVIDPGHQAHANSGLEPVGPGSSDKKAKVSSGTAGVATGIPESKLVLTIGLKLRDALKAHGIKVVMTRTSQDVDLSNIARAQMANAAHANLFIRIHADGTDSSSTNGIHVLYPATIKGWTDDIATASKKAASIAQRDLIAATGAKDRGIDARSDMTGFNWSNVPVILPEIGFMTNPAEDRALATAAYQDKIVKGLTQAVLQFLGVK